MEKLLAMWETFSLSKSEGNQYRMSESSVEGPYLLAARFFTGRVLSMEAIARTFKLLWHTKKGFEVRDMGNHCVLFVFKEETNIARIIAGEPWSFDKNLVALKRVLRPTEMKGLVFDNVRFSVQVHDLPLGSMNMQTASDIVLAAGEVIPRSNEAEDFEGGNFLRVQVSIDITKPLSRGRKVEFNNGDVSWASFKYERLPNLCYWCGRLTHQDQECSFWQNRKGVMPEKYQQFGPWLQANTLNLAKRTVVQVVGYKDEVQGEFAPNSPTRKYGEWDLVEGSSALRTTNEVGQQASCDGDDKGVTMVMQEPRANGNLVSSLGYLTESNVASSSFQAQLDEIDGELCQFDNVKGDLEIAQDGVGSRLVGPALYLKNCSHKRRLPH